MKRQRYRNGDPLFDVFTLQVVDVVGLEAINDGIAIGLQVRHDLFQHVVAPSLTGFVADGICHGCWGFCLQIEPEPAVDVKAVGVGIDRWAYPR